MKTIQMPETVEEINIARELLDKLELELISKSIEDKFLSGEEYISIGNGVEIQRLSKISPHLYNPLEKIKIRVEGKRDVIILNNNNIKEINKYYSLARGEDIQSNNLPQEQIIRRHSNNE